MSGLLELFTVFFKLGAFTIGGGIAMLPLLQNAMIEDKKWLTKEEFMDVVSVCQSLPGVVAVNMATYVGYLRKGLIGSLVATAGVVLPSFTMILIIAKFLTSIAGNPYAEGAMAGFRAAALGLVIVCIVQLAPSVFKGAHTIIAAVTSFVLIAVCGINTAYVILLFLILGIASAFIGGKRVIEAADGQSPDGKEDGR